MCFNVLILIYSPLVRCKLRVIKWCKDVEHGKRVVETVCKIHKILLEYVMCDQAYFFQIPDDEENVELSQQFVIVNAAASECEMLGIVTFAAFKFLAISEKE